MTFPKIELHVHLEGTVRSGTLLQIARRNRVPLPADSLAGHPLPALVAAGIPCSVSTDDPAMFGTDLAADYEAARQLGVSARDCYLAGLRGALCDRPTRDALQQAGEAFDWAGLTPGPTVGPGSSGGVR